MTLHCAFITDEGYFLPTVVAITSLFENLKKGSNVHVHLVAVDLGSESQLRLNKLKDQYKQITLYLKRSEEALQQLSNGSHVSSTALFKFFLPDILSDLSQVLYLDGDLLIDKDLMKAFEHVQLGDHFVAAVKDINVMKRQKVNPLEKFGAKHSAYFNSGVMLLNLRRMRKEGLPEKLLHFKRTHKSLYMDQDAFNYCFNGDVTFLSPELNYLAFGFSSFSTRELTEFYDNTPLFLDDSSSNSPTIYHYASRWKPWRYWIWRHSKMFKTYLAKSPLNDQRLSLNYRVQPTLWVLKGLRLAAPFGLKDAFEPSSKKVSVVNALLAVIEQTARIVVPTGIHLMIEHIRFKKKFNRKTSTGQQN